MKSKNHDFRKKVVYGKEEYGDPFGQEIEDQRDQL
jgi:hypothetical protein